MKKMYFRIVLAFIASLTFSISAHAQWTQYVPVDVQLTQLGGYTGGCYPNADFHFAFPGSPVTGVDYLLIVTQTPPYGVLLMPYNDTLAVNDTLVVMPGTQTYNVYCFLGSGLVSFNIVAKGTPLIANQPYPCSVSANWMSDLGLCPEGLSNNVQNNCLVQMYTGIGESAGDNWEIVYPGNQNNHQLEVSGQFTDAIVTDITGRTIRPEMHGDRAVFHMDHMPAGIYTLSLINGTTVTTKKFTVL